MTPRLPRDTTVLGTGELQIWVRSQARNVDLQATVSEVRPDGKEAFVQGGWLRSEARRIDRERSRLTEPRPSYRQRDRRTLPRGRWVKLRIPLYYQGHVYRKGSRIRVSISASGGDQPIWAFAEAHPAGTPWVAVAHSRKLRSRLVLPVVDRVGAPRGLPPARACAGSRAATTNASATGSSGAGAELLCAERRLEADRIGGQRLRQPAPLRVCRRCAAQGERASVTIRAEPEELPPLELVKLRELDVVEPEREGRASHVAEASGIAKRGDWVYIVGDENLNVGVFRLSSGEPGELRPALSGKLPLDADERKGAKPDLESIATLPPFPGHDYGVMLGLGSGSGPERERGFAWSFDADGSLRGEPAEVDLAPAYELLRSELGELNIEGAAVVGGCLRLLNRGNRDGPNAVCDLSLEQVQRSLHSDLEIDAEEVLAVQAYELGDLNGVPLNFSDGAPIPDGTVVFTASAERDDADDGEDEIEGSVLGVIDSDGSIRRLRTIDRRWKVEGVHATVDSGVLDLLFCCDQDDPDSGSPLLSATMPTQRAEAGSD